MSDAILPETKACTKCHTTKPLSDYSPNKLGRFGVSPACKKCAGLASKMYAEKNRDAVLARKRARRSTPEGKAASREYNKKYAADHADDLRAKRVADYHATKDAKKESKATKDKVYRERKKSEISERRKKKLQSDPEHRARNTERARQWYAANKEAASVKGAEIYKANSEAIKKRVAEYQRANPDATRLLYRIKMNKRRARLREAGGSYTRQDVERIAGLQKWKCANCATSIKKLFHIDHREPVVLGGTNDPGNIELLCPKCNMAKSAKLPHVFAQENGRLI